MRPLNSIWHLNIRQVVTTFTMALLTACSWQSKPNKGQDAFHLHLYQEPSHMNPQRLLGSSSSFFFYNLLRGLYRIDKNGQLVADGGQCSWVHDKKLRCLLENRSWSDGSPVLAEDYIRAFQRLVDPRLASPRAYLLDKISNAKEIINGRLPKSELGVRQTGPEVIEFLFADRDPDFLYKLTSSALYPLHKKHIAAEFDYKHFVGNGPYKIEKWVSGQKIHFTANPHFSADHKKRPPVVMHIIDDDKTAFRLYERGQLSFLRRVPTSLDTQLKGRDDYFQFPLARFDYIGFANTLNDQKNLRQALVRAVDYEKLQTLLRASGRPGCPSLPKDWMDEVPCHRFDIKKATSFLKKVNLAQIPTKLTFKFSTMGGEDIQKQAEFFQAQWERHLNIKIDLLPMENKSYLNELRKSPPDIFRKGINLEIPTCLSALENFTDQSPVNFIQFKTQDLIAFINPLAETTDKKEQAKLCRQANQHLLDSAQMIPLGEIHFNVLAKPKFRGWTLNSLNQLDLSRLTSNN